MPLGIPHSKFLGWDQDDQDKAILWMRREATICDGCGTRRSDWEVDSNAFVAFFETCPGCQRLEEERDNVPKGLKGVRYGMETRAAGFRRIEDMT